MLKQKSKEEVNEYLTKRKNANAKSASFLSVSECIIS